MLQGITGNRPGIINIRILPDKGGQAYRSEFLLTLALDPILFRIYLSPIARDRGRPLAIRYT